MNCMTKLDVNMWYYSECTADLKSIFARSSHDLINELCGRDQTDTYT